MNDAAKVNVLGTDYAIIQSNPSQNAYFDDVDGFCDFTSHEVVYHPYPHDGTQPGWEYSDPCAANKRILRHELVHAFLYESGLAEDSGWAMNESVVDWIARQFPKMLEAFQKAGAL